jgi:hypothetical protein
MQCIKKIFLLTMLCTLVFGCKKDTATKHEPGIAGLIFPEQNAICLSADVLSATESNVIFKWSVTDHTENYELYIKNLLTNMVINKIIKANQLPVTLLRNTPYSWYVVSRSSGSLVSSTSAVWKFYNAGASIVSHIPFPADLISPAFGQKLTGPIIKLTWSGSDVDNDIQGYDVYFGSNATPPLHAGNIKETSLNNLPVQAGNTYYWRITTTDQKSNQSSSETFQFTVN